MNPKNAEEAIRFQTEAVEKARKELNDAKLKESLIKQVGKQQVHEESNPEEDKGFLGGIDKFIKDTRDRVQKASYTKVIGAQDTTALQREQLGGTEVDSILHKRGLELQQANAGAHNDKIQKATAFEEAQKELTRLKQVGADDTEKSLKLERDKTEESVKQLQLARKETEVLKERLPQIEATFTKGSAVTGLEANAAVQAQLERVSNSIIRTVGLDLKEIGRQGGIALDADSKVDNLEKAKGSSGAAREAALKAAGFPTSTNDNSITELIEFQKTRAIQARTGKANISAVDKDNLDAYKTQQIDFISGLAKRDELVRKQLEEGVIGASKVSRQGQTKRLENEGEVLELTISQSRAEIKRLQEETRVQRPGERDEAFDKRAEAAREAINVARLRIAQTQPALEENKDKLSEVAFDKRKSDIDLAKATNAASDAIDNEVHKRSELNFQIEQSRAALRSFEESLKAASLSKEDKLIAAADKAAEEGVEVPEALKPTEGRRKELKQALAREALNAAAREAGFGLSNVAGSQGSGLGLADQFGAPFGGSEVDRSKENLRFNLRQQENEKDRLPLSAHESALAFDQFKFGKEIKDRYEPPTFAGLRESGLNEGQDYGIKQAIGAANYNNKDFIRKLDVRFRGIDDSTISRKFKGHEGENSFYDDKSKSVILRDSFRYNDGSEQGEKDSNHLREQVGAAQDAKFGVSKTDEFRGRLIEDIKKSLHPEDYKQYGYNDKTGNITDEGAASLYRKLYAGNDPNNTDEEATRLRQDLPSASQSVLDNIKFDDLTPVVEPIKDVNGTPAAPALSPAQQAQASAAALNEIIAKFTAESNKLAQAMALLSSSGLIAHFSADELGEGVAAGLNRASYSSGAF